MNSQEETCKHNDLPELLMEVRSLLATIVSPNSLLTNNTILTEKQVMEILSVSENQMRYYRNNGEINYTKRGNKIWYTGKDVMDFIGCPEVRYEYPSSINY